VSLNFAAMPLCETGTTVKLVAVLYESNFHIVFCTALQFSALTHAVGHPVQIPISNSPTLAGSSWA